MPRLVLIRHAKAAWPDHVNDIDRPLAARGVADCAVVADELARRSIDIDYAAVSVATRTQQTWELIATKLAKTPTVTTFTSLYEASVGSILSVINTFNVETLAVVGHAPGMPRTAFALHNGEQNTHLSQLSLKFPTLGIAVLESDKPFSEWEPGSAELVDFFIPRANPNSHDND